MSSRFPLVHNGRVARPSVLTDELRDTIERELAEGIPVVVVAQNVGIGKSSIHSWLGHGRVVRCPPADPLQLAPRRQQRRTSPATDACVTPTRRPSCRSRRPRPTSRRSTGRPATAVQPSGWGKAGSAAGIEPAQRSSRLAPGRVRMTTTRRPCASFPGWCHERPVCSRVNQAATWSPRCAPFGSSCRDASGRAG